ncbi:secreted RxLR effector protein 161-like [Medicago truncatula]|uniref:secreted RxLR effector protein 161-like n=1 Tax=Medicago truncatula TaxID=3880 RepID=UPI0019674622|nr:secreted RxLR effector protein 161-like [Medicago truncatula]
MKLVLNEDEESVDPTLFKQIVGSLRYLCNSRLDIAYAVGIISRFMSEPRVSHLLAAKRVMRYIKGTLQYGILFPKCLNDSSMELMAYSDADWCGDKQDRKSTSGYLFKFLNAPISWCAKKQPVVALSTCESEYIAGCMTACQAV